MRFDKNETTKEYIIQNYGRNIDDKNSFVHYYLVTISNDNDKKIKKSDKLTRYRIVHFEEV